MKQGNNGTIRQGFAPHLSQGVGVSRKKGAGFTLIELLVVIAIIGLLASIVLVSLAGARSRARDARIISSMSQIRSIAEVHLGNTGAYTNLCGNVDVTTLRSDITTQGGTNYLCPTPTATAYCVEVRLNSIQWWCVDSTLRSQQYPSNPACAAGVLRCQ